MNSSNTMFYLSRQLISKIEPLFCESLMCAFLWAFVGKWFKNEKRLKKMFGPWFKAMTKERTNSHQI